MTLTCVIRYQIDPFQRDAFREYAENWGRIIPRLAAYEAYRARLKADPEAGLLRSPDQPGLARK